MTSGLSRLPWARWRPTDWEAVAHFVTKDGRSVALPAVGTLRLRGGLVHDFRFVMDAAPIMQGAQ